MDIHVGREKCCPSIVVHALSTEGGGVEGNLQTEYMPGSLSDVWERILSNICLFVSFFLQILICICAVMLVCAIMCVCVLMLAGAVSDQVELAHVTTTKLGGRGGFLGSV